MPFVGPDRFDDVEYTVLEQPEPPQRWRPQRWLLAPLASVLIIGSLAAGASAVTSDGSASRLAPKDEGWESYAPVKRGGHDCDRKRERRDSELRY
jgi:hypothetical protein